MWADLRTLFWLQGKLSLAAFRTGRTGDQLEGVRLITRLVTLLLLLPMFVVFGAAMVVALVLLSPAAAYEVAMVVNTFLFVVWLLLPASASSQIIERFEMSRLFPYPISFRSIVVGSTLVATLTMTGLWTLPMLLGEVVGLAWHQPAALPIIAIGAVPMFALLVLTGRVMEDSFDLVAGDRRLRGLALVLLSLPFMLCWLGQYGIQHVTDNYQRLPAFLEPYVAEELVGIGEPETFSEFLDASSAALEVLRPSRFLVWLPPGWATAGMALPVRGAWGQGLLFLLVSLGSVALLLGVHARVTRRLMEGAALQVGAERIRSRGLELGLPGPPGFWALAAKDWRYLWRSPMPRRMLFSAVMMAAAVSVPLRDLGRGDPAGTMRRAAPMLAFAFAATMTGMGTNMAMAANYFGAFDREGFATLALSPVDRRYTLLSANLSVLLYVMGQGLMLVVVIAALTGSWYVVPLGLYLVLCMQVGSTPVCTLAATLAPYRTQLKFSRGHRQGNMWGMLAWLVSAPPLLAMVLLPFLFWPPGLILTLPLAAVYSGALYGLTLGPLSRVLMRREYAILRGVTASE